MKISDRILITLKTLKHNKKDWIQILLCSFTILMLLISLTAYYSYQRFGRIMLEDGISAHKIRIYGIDETNKDELINDSAISGQIEAALAKAQAAGLSDSTLLTAIGGNKEAINGLATLTATNFGQVDNALRGLERGLCDLGYRVGQDTASLMSAISQGDASLSRQLSECCCNTQRAIDSVNYNMASNFGALTNSVDKGLCALSHQVDNKIDMAQMENRAGFQSIRDMFTNDKIANLQRELELSQFQNSQQSQTQALKDYVASYFGCPPGVINCNQQ